MFFETISYAFFPIFDFFKIYLKIAKYLKHLVSSILSRGPQHNENSMP